MNASAAADSVRRIRVLQSIRAIRPSTNPYITELLSRLSSDVDIEMLSWRQALLGRYDVFHVHWPEHVVSRRSAARQTAHSLLFIALLVRLRLTRTPIVRTLHNPVPHERQLWLTRRILAAVDRRTILWIALNPWTVPAEGSVVVIPHPHYRDWYSEFPRSAATPSRVGFFGQVREYKNVEGLVSAFAQVDDDSATLAVWGRAEPALEQRLRALAALDSRVELRLEHLPDAELAAMITASSLIALPYREMGNSGALLLALSLDRPVLVPDNPATAALADEVGIEWVRRYTGELTADVLRAAIQHATQSDAGRPRLDKREWPEILALHVAAFERAIALARRS